MIREIRSWIFWHIIFPRMEYVKRDFEKVKHKDGSVTYIRKKRVMSK